MTSASSDRPSATPSPKSAQCDLGRSTHDGTASGLNVQVVDEDDVETAETLCFRDRLQTALALVTECVARIQAALASGPTGNIAYNRAKQSLFLDTLTGERS